MGDIVPPTVKEKDLREEVNRRTAKAGYTTAYGECTARTKIQALSNWGKQRLNIWKKKPRSKKGKD